MIPPPDPHSSVGDSSFSPEECVVDENCKIVSCPEDENKHRYQPDVKNWMGYYQGYGNHFSTEQQKVAWCFAERVHNSKIKSFLPKSALETKLNLIVGKNAPYPSLQKAVEDSSDGATIQIQPGFYSESFLIEGVHLTLRGMGSASKQVVLVGKLEASILTIRNSQIKLEKVLLTEGKAERGGLISSKDSSVSFSEVLMDSGRALYDGGCLFAIGSSITMDQVEMTDCAAFDYGGAISALDSDLILKNTQINHNQGDKGGAIEFTEFASMTPKKPHQLLLSHTGFGNNTASEGGALYLTLGGMGTFTNVDLSGNSASLRGAALFLWSNDGAVNPGLLYQGGSISGNEAKNLNGSAVSLLSGSLDITGVSWGQLGFNQPHDIEFSAPTKPIFVDHPKDNAHLVCEASTAKCVEKKP